MLQYVIVRYTREEICFVDGEAMAKAIANGLAKRDYEGIDAWYTIEPNHVY